MPCWCAGLGLQQGGVRGTARWRQQALSAACPPRCLSCVSACLRMSVMSVAADTPQGACTSRPGGPFPRSVCRLHVEGRVEEMVLLARMPARWQVLGAPKCSGLRALGASHRRASAAGDLIVDACAACAAVSGAPGCVCVSASVCLGVFIFVAGSGCCIVFYLGRWRYGACLHAHEHM